MHYLILLAVSQLHRSRRNGKVGAQEALFDYMAAPRLSVHVQKGTSDVLTGEEVLMESKIVICGPQRDNISPSMSRTNLMGSPCDLPLAGRLLHCLNMAIVNHKSTVNPQSRRGRSNQMSLPPLGAQRNIKHEGSNTAYAKNTQTERASPERHDEHRLYKQRHRNRFLHMHLYSPTKHPPIAPSSLSSFSSTPRPITRQAGVRPWTSCLSSRQSCRIERCRNGGCEARWPSVIVETAHNSHFRPSFQPGDDVASRHVLRHIGCDLLACADWGSIGPVCRVGEGLARCAARDLISVGIGLLSSFHSRTARENAE